MSEYRLNVYEAINQVSLAMSRDGITKGRKNEQQGYAFRGIDDMYNALSIPLASIGLCIIPRFRNRTVTERVTQKGGTLFYVTIEGEFDLVGPDGSKHTALSFGEAMDSGDKATNKAMSAAFKYMCMQLFCIPTEGDNDADATTHELQARADAVAQRRIKELTPTVSPTVVIELADSLDQTPEPPLMAPDVKKPPKKVQTYMSESAKLKWKQAKMQLNAVRKDNDKFYYDAMAPYKHCTHIPTKEEADMRWKILQSGLAPEGPPKHDLTLEQELRRYERENPKFIDKLGAHGFESIQQVIEDANGTQLGLLLSDLRQK